MRGYFCPPRDQMRRGAPITLGRSSVDAMLYQDPDYTALCSSKTLQSEDKGFFLDFADQVAEVAGTEWIAQNRTDEARVQACYGLGDCVHSVLDNVRELYKQKNAPTSAQKRQEGDRYLNAGDPRHALLLYNHAVMRAPSPGVDVNVDGGLSLALALAARSEALLQLEEHEASLTDIQLALKENFPVHLRYQLYWRMGRCYRGLGQIPKAQVSMRLAATLVSENKDNIGPMEMIATTARLNAELGQLDILDSSREAKKALEPPKPSVTHGENPKMPGASRLVTVESSSEQGRYAVASDHIATGDIVAVEPPYAACLLPDKFGTHCHHCFKRLLAPVACAECSGVAFCSSACKDTAVKTYHQYECHYMDLLVGSGMSILCHLALRMVTQSGLQYFKQVKDSLRESLQQFNGESGSYASIYNLVTHAHMRPPHDFLQRTLMALFLLRVLQHGGFFSNNITKKLTADELYIGSLLLRNLQLLQFNAHEIFETCIEAPNKVRGSKTLYVAVGIYPTVAATFNHDCHPALARYFAGNNIVLQALRPLEKGDSVTENYGPIFTKRPLANRQKTLASRYWFQCSCQACKEDWPTYDTLSNDHFRFRCPTKGCTQLSKKAHKRCPKCKKQVSLQEGLVQETAGRFNEGMDVMEEGELEQAFQIFRSYLDIMYSLGCGPCRDMSLCQDALRACLALRGNTWIVRN